MPGSPMQNSMFAPSTGYRQKNNPFPVTSCGRRRNLGSPLFSAEPRRTIGPGKNFNKVSKDKSATGGAAGEPSSRERDEPISRARDAYPPPRDCDRETAGAQPRGLRDASLPRGGGCPPGGLGGGGLGGVDSNEPRLLYESYMCSSQYRI